MRGRKPHPAGVRQLLNARTRSHHHDRLPDDDAEGATGSAGNLEPADIDIPAPHGLVRGERAYWNQFAPLLAGVKVLTPADVQTLADYCRSCYWVEDASRRLRTCWKKRNPDLKKIRMLDAQVRGWVERKTKLAIELGLTAISRTRIGWTGHQAPTPGKKQAAKKSRVAELQEQAADLHRPLELVKG